MNKLKIPHQILNAEATGKIEPDSKVICVSPEKLMDPRVTRELNKLEWSCICIDEPHLALIWGTTKSRLKPFREAFSKLSCLNNLSACFELHSATIFDEVKLFELLGRKNSKWTKQIQLPNRPNLTIYLISGKRAPENILNLPSVTRAFDDANGLLLIFVQRISDGSSIHLTLLEYCEENGYIRFCAKENKPHKPLAFLHSSLSEEAKKRILTEASEKKLRVLIATNSAGSGINIPVTGFIGWGMDPEPCGVIQAMGRTCRKPVTQEGAVIWVHSPRIHGRRVSGKSKVRELLNNDACLRKTSNDWFGHGLELSKHVLPEPEYCCSRCMEKCAEKNKCEKCLQKLSQYFPCITSTVDIKAAQTKLTGFLEQLKINESVPGLTFPYKEESLSEEIMIHIKSSNSLDDLEEFLQIFSLGKVLTENICKFISSAMKESLVSECENKSDFESESDTTSSSEDDSESDISSEYFDEEESNIINIL